MIKEKRKKLNYTQEQMANFLDISTRQYIRIEHEEDLPRRDILKKIIDILHLTNEEIGNYIRVMVSKEVK